MVELEGSRGAYHLTRTAALALHGGPHSSLGAWPWSLQLPGILLVLFVSGETHFWWRVGGMLLVQISVWYAFITLVRRRGRRATAA